MGDPAAALKQIVPELKRKADYLVLLAHATMEESVALAKQFPEFNVVVTSDGPEVPPAEPETVQGTKTMLITVGHKGMDVVVLGLFDDRRQPTVRYQRVPLDSRFAASPEMKMLMAAYQDQLKTIGFAGLGLRPVPHPLAETNGRFVGSAKCESCHEESYDVWKKSKHAHAYETLAKLDPPRNFDPECVSCHVVGWHPTEFLPLHGRLREPGEDAAIDQHRLRGLPRPRREALHGRDGQQRAVAEEAPQGGGRSRRRSRRSSSASLATISTTAPTSISTRTIRRSSITRRSRWREIPAQSRLSAADFLWPAVAGRAGGGEGEIPRRIRR